MDGLFPFEVRLQQRVQLQSCVSAQQRGCHVLAEVQRSIHLDEEAGLVVLYHGTCPCICYGLRR